MTPLHLYLDIGNSRVKWALAFPDATLGKWYQCGTHRYDLYSLLATQIQAHLVEKIWCANVTGSGVKTFLEQQVAYLTYRPEIQFIVTAKKYLHLHNAYHDPQQLGIDRWLAALSASYHYSKQNLFIISMGTATTIDLVDKNGIFLGGWIFPGLTTMSVSLEKATAQLPAIDFLQNCRGHSEMISDFTDSGKDNAPSSVVELNDKAYTQSSSTSVEESFGRNTISAIRQGCLAAQIGAIKYCLSLSETYIGSHPVCILTGGAGHAISQKLNFPIKEIKDLVLQGLQLYAKNGSSP